MTYEKAVEFVELNGNDVEKARLAYLLTNSLPSKNVVAQLFAAQKPDGGWSPFWAEAYSSVDATCFRLAKAEQLGLGRSETAIVRAIDFLVGRQSPDGSWEEDKKVAPIAPPWAAPGDLSATLYLTANCGWWMAFFGNPDQSAIKAADFLNGYLEPDGHMPSFLHTLWLAGSLWHKLDQLEAAEKVFQYLNLSASDLGASNLAWMIITTRLAGVPPFYPLLDQAAALLENTQREDGCWPSEDGPESDVHSTLEALRALWLCGRVGRTKNYG